MAEVNIPDEAVDAGWWTSSGQDMREQDIREVVAAAAPLIVADYLERLVTDLEAVKQEMRAVDARSIQLAGVIAAIVRTREHIARLRGGAR